MDFVKVGSGLLVINYKVTLVAVPLLFFIVVDFTHGSPVWTHHPGSRIFHHRNEQTLWHRFCQSHVKWTLAGKVVRVNGLTLINRHYSNRLPTEIDTTYWSWQGHVIYKPGLPWSCFIINADSPVACQNLSVFPGLPAKQCDPLPDKIWGNARAATCTLTEVHQFSANDQFWWAPT